MDHNDLLPLLPAWVLALSQMTKSNMAVTKLIAFSDDKSKFAYPITRQQILDSSKLKEFADDIFKFDENGRKLFKMGRKHFGKRRNCSL